MSRICHIGCSAHVLGPFRLKYNSFVSLLTFFINDLSTDKSILLMSSVVTVMDSSPPFKFINVYILYLGAPDIFKLGIYIYTIYVQYILIHNLYTILTYIQYTYIFRIVIPSG